jgi:hypothetical protein
MNFASLYLGCMTSSVFVFTGKLSTESINPPVRFTTFFPLKNAVFYREEDEAELLSYRCLLVGHAAYMYNQKAVMAVSGE